MVRGEREAECCLGESGLCKPPGLFWRNGRTHDRQPGHPDTQQSSLGVFAESESAPHPRQNSPGPSGLILQTAGCPRSAALRLAQGLARHLPSGRPGLSPLSPLGPPLGTAF